MYPRHEIFFLDFTWLFFYLFVFSILLNWLHILTSIASLGWWLLFIGVIPDRLLGGFGEKCPYCFMVVEFNYVFLRIVIYICIFFKLLAILPLVLGYAILLVITFILCAFRNIGGAHEELTLRIFSFIYSFLSFIYLFFNISVFRL